MLTFNGVQLLNFKQGYNHRKFYGVAKSMGGRNLFAYGTLSSPSLLSTYLRNYLPLLHTFLRNCLSSLLTYVIIIFSNYKYARLSYVYLVIALS